MRDKVHRQGFGALGVACHTCGVWDGIDEPQAGQPANGWRKIVTGAQPSPPPSDRIVPQSTGWEERSKFRMDRGDAGARQQWNGVPRGATAH